jgi:hypothetical protein
MRTVRPARVRQSTETAAHWAAVFLRSSSKIATPNLEKWSWAVKCSRPARGRLIRRTATLARGPQALMLQDVPKSQFLRRLESASKGCPSPDSGKSRRPGPAVRQHSSARRHPDVVDWTTSGTTACAGQVGAKDVARTNADSYTTACHNRGLVWRDPHPVSVYVVCALRRGCGYRVHGYLPRSGSR